MHSFLRGPAPSTSSPLPQQASHLPMKPVAWKPCLRPPCTAQALAIPTSPSAPSQQRGNWVGSAVEVVARSAEDAVTTLPSTSAIPILSPDNFEQSLVEHGNLVLVDFYTDFCGPCKLMHPHFEKLQPVFKKIRFVKYNCGVEGHEALASRHRIRSLPTFRLYCAGKMVEEVTGARPVQLRQMLIHHHR